MFKRMIKKIAKIHLDINRDFQVTSSLAFDMSRDDGNGFFDKILNEVFKMLSAIAASNACRTRLGEHSR